MMATLFRAAAIAPAQVARLASLENAACKIPLALRLRWRYRSSVTEKDVTEFDSSNTHSGQTAQCGFFTSVYSWHSFNGGLGRGAERHAGGCVCRSVNPAQFRHPHLTVRGGLTAHTGGYMPSTATSKNPYPVPLMHIAGKADCISALLSIYDLLPEADQCRALETCAGLAGELARCLPKSDAASAADDKGNARLLLAAPALLSELIQAEQIIIAMLGTMTHAQKASAHAELNLQGVSGEGMTRFHERRAVIASASLVRGA